MSPTKKYGTFFSGKLPQKSPSPGPNAPKGNDDEENMPLVEEEMRSTGEISLGLYYKYIRAGSGFFRILFIAVLNLVTQVLFTGCDYWLKFW